MVSKKPTLLVIAGTLIIAWLLVTSIHPIQPVNSIGTTSNQQQQQQNSQQGPGVGNNNGNNNNGGGGGGCFLCWNFSLNFPNLFHFNWPRFNITWPSIKWPSIRWPSWGFGSGSGGGTGSGVGPGTGDGSGDSNGGGGGGGGSGGSSGAIQAQTTTTHQVQPLFKIPTDVLIAIIIIIMIIAGAFLVLKSKNTLLNRKKGNAQQLQEPEAVPPIMDLQNPSNQNASSYAVQFEGDEIVSDLVGWGTLGGFLKPRINESLPLIWSIDEPLEIGAPEGATVILGKDTPVTTFPLQDGVISGSVTFKETCNVVHGVYQDAKDMKWIRAVHYDEDVMKLFRLNFLISSKEEENIYGTLTPREIVSKIITEKAELVKDQSALYPIARIFERAFYGRKMISREEYELFLISLSKALTSPKVIICGPKN